MIPVQGVENQTIAILGLGRSGRATATALVAGGAQVIAWDDGADTRAAAEAEGLRAGQAGAPLGRVIGREAVATRALERLDAADLGPLATVADLPGLPAV